MEKINFTEFDSDKSLIKKLQEYLFKTKKVNFKKPITFTFRGLKCVCSDVNYDSGLCRCTITRKEYVGSIYVESFKRVQILKLMKAINNNI